MFVCYSFDQVSLVGSITSSVIWGTHKSEILTVSSEDLQFTRGDEVFA